MSVQQYGAAAMELAKDEIKKWIKSKLKIVAIIIVVIASILIPFFIAIAGSESESTSSNLSLVPGTIYGNTIQEKVWYGMRSLGFSEISTAAAMGNFHHESGINAEAIEYGYNENNGGIGICQWTNSPRESGEGRNTQLKKYAESKGTTWQDENTQVEFLLAEISKSGSASEYATYQLKDTDYTGTSYSCDDWINAKDTATLDETKLRELTEIFCYTFERPSKSAGESSMDKRYAYALQYYEQFHGQSIPYASSGLGSSYTGSTFTDSTGKTYRLYKQGSTEFKNVAYPARGKGATIGANGCGPTSCCIIGSAYGYTDTPASLVSSGKCYSCFSDIPNYFTQRGFTVKTYTTLNDEQIKAKLTEGYDIIVLTKKGYIGNYSVSPYNHWYTLLDVNESGQVFVGDPIVKRWWMV